MRKLSTQSCGAAAALMIALLVLVSSANAQWTAYHGDGGRSGIDSSSTGSVPFSPAWTTPVLAGDIYGQPVVYKGLVIVATESDDIYAFNESTGAVVWHRSVGTAVDASALPCGDISPTVGVTSTPVIDPATSRVFVVADTWDGSHASSIKHALYGFNVSDGSGVSGLPVQVDPPGTDHTALLQRTALALDAGKVIIGYGGNAGDCGTYHGWLVAAPETGGAEETFGVSAASGGGAIWGAGDGAAVDASANVWVATGNGFGSPYGYQESVLKLNSNLSLLDHWAPSNWLNLDNSDTDLGSSDPLLLPGGLVFQIGKQGIGYLLSAANLGGTGGTPLYNHQVCGHTSDASFGGDVYYNGVLYVTCSDGLRALALNASAHTFAPLTGWKVSSNAIGPPIVSGGLVWATDWNGATLYGLNPTTGQVVVNQSTPSMEHFTTPSASDGKLFVATSQTVEAYNIAHPVIAVTNPPPPPPPPSCSCGAPRCRTRLRLIQPHHGRITHARVYFHHKVLGRKRGRRLRRISFESPSGETSFKVRLLETTSRGHKLRFRVSFLDCRQVRAHRLR